MSGQTIRRHKRYNMIASSLKVFNAGSYDPLGDARNISKEGFMLHTKAIMEKGNNYLMTIELPDGDKIDVCATCIWSEPVEDSMNGSGFHITKIDDENKQKLDDFLYWL